MTLLRYPPKKSVVLKVTSPGANPLQEAKSRGIQNILVLRGGKCVWRLICAYI